MPAPEFDDDATGERTENRGHAPDTADEALHFRALRRRIENTDNNKRQRINSAAAETLNRAKEHERFHAWRQAAQGRAENEDGDTDEHEPALAIEIGKFAEQRRGQRRREHVNGK